MQAKLIQDCIFDTLLDILKYVNSDHYMDNASLFCIKTCIFPVALSVFVSLAL